MEPVAREVFLPAGADQRVAGKAGARPGSNYCSGPYAASAPEADRADGAHPAIVIGAGRHGVGAVRWPMHGGARRVPTRASLRGGRDSAGSVPCGGSAIRVG